jgi:hypothetical protein
MEKEKAMAMAKAKAKGTAKSKEKEEQEEGKGKGQRKGKGKGKEGKKKQDMEEEYEDYDCVFWEETESKEYLKRRMVIEQGMFNNHRVGWEHIWGSKIGLCGGFQDTSK